MTDQLKLIVGALNAPPFNRRYNLISLDGLEPQQLLQLLSDVLCTVQGVPSVEIRTEASEDTALRLFNALRVLKYRPPVHDSEELSEWRRSVVEGEQQAVWGVLEWVLERVPELQNRAYLAKYLIRVPVPPDFASEPEVEALMVEAEELMETFKEVHREAEAIKSEGLGTADVRADLTAMEAEREQLGRRLARVERKAEAAPDREAHLRLAAALRSHSDKAADLALHKAEQRNGLVHAEQKISRLHQALKELDEQAASTRPEDLIKKLEEENQTTGYMVKEKLPKEMGVKRKAVQELQRVLAQPAMDKTDLDAIMKKISHVNNEYNNLVEKRNVAADPTEDKISIFRNQATIVERKKEAAAERLQEFKNYVNKLRGKTNVYKKKRSELQDLRAEIGVLSRTDEILRAQLEALKKVLAERGEELREAAPSSQLPKPQRPQTASTSRDHQELKKILTTFEHKVEEERRRIESLLQGLRPLRENYQEMSDLYRRQKGEFETAAAGLESGYSRLEAAVKELRTESAAEGRSLLQADISLRLLDPDAARQFQQQLQARLQEAESTADRLGREQVPQDTAAAPPATQIKLWRDLLRIMEAKRQHANASH